MTHATSRQHADIVRSNSATAFLSPANPLKRLPPASRRKRPESFWRAFEQDALFYDCFWHLDGRRVVLIGPPPLNLKNDLEAVVFKALPTDAPLRSAIHRSRSTVIVELFDVTGSEITFEMAGEQFVLPIGENFSARFADRRVMVTMNKDNDLDWIGGWAKWHALAHGVDAVIVFDNGSTRYGIAEIEAALAGISGIRTICVLDWPFKYGRKDPALLDHPHYPHFLQIASLNVTLRRFASKAQGLLNCDVDELVGTNGQGSAFKQLRLAPQGIITLAGRWVETIADGAGIAGIAHTNYRSTHRLGMLSVCADKWIIDPSQPWLAPLEAKPSVHRIYDVDRRIGRSAPRLPFWHFKAINTNWKQKRTSPSRFNAAFHRRLTSLDHEIERVLGK